MRKNAGISSTIKHRHKVCITLLNLLSKILCRTWFEKLWNTDMSHTLDSWASCHSSISLLLFTSWQLHHNNWNIGLMRKSVFTQENTLVEDFFYVYKWPSWKGLSRFKAAPFVDTHDGNWKSKCNKMRRDVTSIKFR